MTEFKSWEDYTPLEQAQSEFSDYFKSVHGWRPRFCSDWTLEDYDREFDSLAEDAKIIFAAEEAAEKDALLDFQKLINDTIQLGAGSWKKAMDWLIQAEDGVAGYFDLGMFLYEQNIGYDDRKVIEKRFWAM